MKAVGLSISLCLCTALVVPAWAFADDGKAAAAVPEQTLNGVTVQGQQNPLSRSDRRLRQLRQALPQLGSDARKKRGLPDRAREYLARHSDPEAASGQQRRMMERARQPQGTPDSAGER